MPEIAKAAGVALKTVYVGFDTKAGLLRVLWDERLSGAEADIPVTERAWYRGVFEEADPERKLRLVAAQSRVVKSCSGALMEVIRNASAADPEIAQLWDDIKTKLYDVSRSIVEQLDQSNALTAALDVAVATDLLWTLNHPSIWQLLVAERGWAAEQYEEWLGENLCSQLLRGPESQG